MGVTQQISCTARLFPWPRQTIIKEDTKLHRMKQLKQSVGHQLSKQSNIKHCCTTCYTLAEITDVQHTCFNIKMEFAQAGIM